MCLPVPVGWFFPRVSRIELHVPDAARNYDRGHICFCIVYVIQFDIKRIKNRLAPLPPHGPSKRHFTTNINRYMNFSDMYRSRPSHLPSMGNFTTNLYLNLNRYMYLTDIYRIMIVPNTCNFFMLTKIRKMFSAKPFMTIAPIAIPYMPSATR